MEPDNLVKTGERDNNGKFVEGHTGIGGRPKGKTMKEFVREYLLNQTEEQKMEWLKDIPKDVQWRMAEGNPKQETEGKVDINVIPIFGGQSHVQTNNSDAQDIQP